MDFALDPNLNELSVSESLMILGDTLMIRLVKEFPPILS